VKTAMLTIRFLVVVTVVAVVEAEADWAQRVARDMFLSLTDMLVFSSLAERKICSSQRTWFPYV